MVTTTTDSRADLAGIETRHVDVDGVDVHVGVVGSGTTGVLLYHHFYGNVATWRRVLRRLDARGVHAVAVDRPGFGWTRRPDPAARPEAYTRSFAARAGRVVASARGIERLVVVGSSMGGTLAVETTLGDPAGVEHLLLLAPAITGDVGFPVALRPLLRRPAARRVLRPLVGRLSRDIDLERATGGWHDRSLAGVDDVAAYAEPTRLPGWADGIVAVMASEGPPSLLDDLATVRPPATVVSGRHDRTIRPRWNRRTAATLGADLVELPTGHTPQEEAPDLVTDLIADVVPPA